jgi:hypothetical protein
MDESSYLIKERLLVGAGFEPARFNAALAVQPSAVKNFERQANVQSFTDSKKQDYFDFIIVSYEKLNPNDFQHEFPWRAGSKPAPTIVETFLKYRNVIQIRSGVFVFKAKC